MKNVILSLIILFIPLFNSLNSQINDPLWNRALTVSKANSNWIPGAIFENDITKNSDGKREESIQREISVFESKDYDLKFILEKCIIDGENKTETERGQYQSDNFSNNYIKPDEAEDPLQVIYQKNISKLKRTGKESLQNKLCIVFEYIHQTKEILWKGKIWLEEETGIPVKLIIVTDQIITHNKSKIKNLKTEINFNKDSTKWYPLKTRYTSNIEINILPFVTFEGTTETTIKFDDYFKLRDDK